MNHVERAQVTVLVDEYIKEHGLSTTMADVRAYVASKVDYKVNLKNFALALKDTEYAKGLRSGTAKPPSQQEISSAGQLFKH